MQGWGCPPRYKLMPVMPRASMKLLPVLCLCLMALVAHPVRALDKIELRLSGQNTDSLVDKLRAASLLKQAERDKMTAPQDLYSTALADYRRLVETLYANGYYTGQVSIRIDGTEAALIPVFSPPAKISNIAITVNPGKPFAFGKAQITPLAPGSTLPESFATGQRARAGAVIGATQQAVDDWRDQGHAKAEVASDVLVADHARQTLDASVTLNPGPRVRFGQLVQAGSSTVKPGRIVAIAGLPSGEVYSPAALEKSANRLRRTGAFQSVTLKEQGVSQPGDVMDIEATVVDALPRRYGLGVELSNQDGLALSGFWMHRNIFGRADMLRVEGEVADIYGAHSGVDYRVGLRFERPATFGPDTKAYLDFELASLQDPNGAIDSAYLAVGATRLYSDHLTGELEIALSHAQTRDVFGKRSFTLLATPIRLEWDRRDKELNPKHGHYLGSSLTPYLGLSGEESGAQIKLDGRFYRSFGPEKGLTAAARLQFGSVVGSSLAGTAPGYLFLSGGGGTVRGQPYQSLGVDVGTGTSGGRSFIGLSGEVRAKVTEAISIVGFADTGYIGSESFYDGSGLWHSGAGLGLRYDTSVGPIRLDVAAPVSGPTGSGVQVYIGIGQAF